MGQTITGSTSANAKLYSMEYIEGFERGASLLRQTVTTEIMQRGSQFVFVVEDSGNATATTRGLDGNIVPRSMNNNQVTLSLTEWHDLPRMSGFNIFGHQASAMQRAAMFKTSYKVISRTVENEILTALGTATTGPSGTAIDSALDLVTQGLVNLGNNFVTCDDGDVYVACTPGFLASLQRTKEFSNAEYVSMKKWDDGVSSTKKMYQWNGMNFFIQNGLSGVGTSSATCFMYHKTAIGHAINKENFEVEMDYNKEQNYSWVRASAFSGAALLQNTGVQKLLFNDASAGALVTI
jgi:hypothetical protein